MAKHLPFKYVALNLKPSTTKRRERERERNKDREK
jgi:hypothetical protein